MLAAAAASAARSATRAALSATNVASATSTARNSVTAMSVARSAEERQATPRRPDVRLAQTVALLVMISPFSMHHVRDKLGLDPLSNNRRRCNLIHHQW